MALKVRLSPFADADFAAIRAYLVPRSPQGAERIRRAIEATIDRLAEFPGIGRPAHIAGVRVVTVSGAPYHILHKVSGDELHIIHIRHSARREPTDLPN